MILQDVLSLHWYYEKKEIFCIDFNTEVIQIEMPRWNINLEKFEGHLLAENVENENSGDWYNNNICN